MTSTEQWLKWESRSFTGTSYQEINEQLMHTTFSGVWLTPLSAGSTRLYFRLKFVSTDDFDGVTLFRNSFK